MVQIKLDFKRIYMTVKWVLTSSTDQIGHNWGESNNKVKMQGSWQFELCGQVL